MQQSYQRAACVVCAEPPPRLPIFYIAGSLSAHSTSLRIVINKWKQGEQGVLKISNIALADLKGELAETFFLA